MTKDKTSELILACPKCGLPNFTARGLRGHRCEANQKDGIDLPLTKEEWEAAVKAAKEQSAGREPCHPTGEKLELLAPLSAETEKKIAGHVKVIRAAVKGNERARNLFFAYAAIAGAHANGREAVRNPSLADEDSRDNSASRCRALRQIGNARLSGRLSL